MEIWPENLPLILRRGKTRTYTETYRMDFPYSGRPYVEPITDDDLVYFTGSLIMTKDQAQRFQVFFMDIRKGQDPFQIPIKTEFGLVPQVAQALPGCFLETVQEGPSIWKYNINVVIPDFKLIDDENPDLIFEYIKIGWSYPEDFSVFDVTINSNWPEG